MFLCTGNSCRSQMAETWAKKIAGDKLEVRSAGIEAHGYSEEKTRSVPSDRAWGLRETVWFGTRTLL